MAQFTERKFTFNYEVSPAWRVDNIPLRFPNAGHYDYCPLHIDIEGGFIDINIRRDKLTGDLYPPLGFLTRCLQVNTTYPLCVTISWRAIAFPVWRLATPPWNGLIGPDICPDCIEPLRPYLNLLISHISRWKAFRIFSPLVTHLREEFSRIPRGGSATILESLILMDVEQDAEIEVLSTLLLNLIQYGKKFRELFLLDNHDRAVIGAAAYPSLLSIYRTFPPLPYDRLTTLRVDHKLSTIDTLRFLTRAGKLEVCTFNSITGPTVSGHVKTVTCNSLKYLKLSNYEGDTADFKTTGAIHSLLKKISAPCLKKLVLECEDEWDAEAFTTFITQSSCVLVSLHIINMGINAEELISCLELAGDSLVDLLLRQRDGEPKLGNNLLTPHFIHRFSYYNARKHDCLCPMLQLISIGDRSLDGSGEFGCALSTRVEVTPLVGVKILCTDIARRGAYIEEMDESSLQQLEKRIEVYLARDPCDGL